MVKLQHISLGLTRYTTASSLQNALARKLLDSKANPSLPNPPPTILTAQFHPVYTNGRRDAKSPSPTQLAQLLQNGSAEFHTTLRGGQITFHGPGQLVAYPVLDLKRHALSARCYVNLLETCLIQTCARYGLKTMRTENTGVWVSDHDKIAAIGVHLRRGVSRDGVALNVSTDLGWFERIVACGLEGKGTTSLKAQGVDVGVDDVGKAFVDEMARELKGVDGVEVKTEEELGLESVDVD